MSGGASGSAGGRLWYLPLEPYEERYTRQLLAWVEERWASRADLRVVLGAAPTDEHIRTGVVLDAVGRSRWALSQTAALLDALALADRVAPLSGADAIFLHDLFHPGWEALPYWFDQRPAGARPRLYAQNWAQSVDVYDFTFPMRRWMRGYEQMCDATATGLFLASAVQVDLWRAAALDRAPLHVVGLPFDLNEVRQRAGVARPRPWAERAARVVFTARWDAEKQPHFFLDLVLAARGDPRFAGVEFALCTGAPQLRSNDPAALARARAFAADGALAIYDGLSKRRYYELLGASRVQFNCALQDFVSFTLLEASALGTPSLYPAFRSFPDALGHDPRLLYVPWSRTDALGKLAALLDAPPPPAVVERPARHHHGTLDRVLAVLQQRDEASAHVSD